MTNPLEDRIGTLLTRKAGQIDNVPGGDQLAADAERRGRRLKTRRQLLTGVAGAAALAVAVPVGAQVLGRREERVVPTDPAKPPTVTLDPGKLPKGAPPAVPWCSGGELHSGDRTTRVGRRVITFLPTEGGYVVLVPDKAEPRHGRVLLVDFAGDTIGELHDLLDGLPSAVSGDGRRLAAMRSAENQSAYWNDRGSLVLIDAANGETLAERSIRSRPFPTVAGFVGEQVVFALADPTKFHLWNPTTDKVTTVEGGGWPSATDGRDRVIAATAVNKDYEVAAHDVYSVSAGKWLWHTRDLYEQPKLTQDGRYVAGNDRNLTKTVVLDAATGRTLLNLKGKGIMVNYVVESEPSGALLFWVTGDEDPGVIVRCTVDGRCELATGPLATRDSPLATRKG